MKVSVILQDGVLCSVLLLGLAEDVGVVAAAIRQGLLVDVCQVGENGETSLGEGLLYSGN